MLIQAKAKIETGTIGLAIAAEWCVALNNYEFLQIKMEKLSEQIRSVIDGKSLEAQVLRDSIKQCFEAVYAAIRKNMDYIINAVNQKVPIYLTRKAKRDSVMIYVWILKLIAFRSLIISLVCLRLRSLH
jgi:hypothetical protein